MLYSCLKDNNDWDKKVKGTKKCVLQTHTNLNFKIIKIVEKKLKLKIK